MKKTAAALFAGLLALPVLAHDFTAGDLFIDHPWSRAMPPNAVTGAAYLRIENRGETPDRLLGAETPVAAYTELHEHIHQDGLMKMQQVQALSVKPGETVEFEPGGYHIMLFNLQQPLVAGEDFKMVLEFEQAGSVEVTVNVEDGSSAGHDHHGHSDGEDDHSHHHH